MKLKKGFTLMELLIVMSIIGILLGVVFANVRASREKSRQVQAKADVSRIANAVQMMYADTRFYPKGQQYMQFGGDNYPTSSIVGNPFTVDATGVGLYTTLPVCSPPTTTGCITSANVWKGPYINSNLITDPWKHSYIVDFKYLGPPFLAGQVVVMSKGKNTSATGNGMCDDIYVSLAQIATTDPNFKDSTPLKTNINNNNCTSFSGAVN